MKKIIFGTMALFLFTTVNAKDKKKRGAKTETCTQTTCDKGKTCQPSDCANLSCCK